MSESIECVVIGAGVIGLAVARALALRGRETLVLEAESAIGTATSSRNSEVIHAGIYYPPGSAKARFCVAGKQLLYEFCEARGVDTGAAANSSLPWMSRRFECCNPLSVRPAPMESWISSG